MLLAGCANPTARPLSVSPAVLWLTPNVDDDQGDGLRDGLAPAQVGDDELQSVQVSVGAVRVQVLNAPEGELRLWEQVDGKLRALTPQAVTSPATRAVWVEVVRGASASWNGQAELLVERDGIGRRVALHARPFVLPHVEVPATRLWVVDVPSTVLGDDLVASGLPVSRVPASEVGNDRWLPDSFLPVQVSGAELRAWFRTGRPMRAPDWADRHQLRQGVGVVSAGVEAGSLADASGNVLVLPPHRGFPLGRVLVGTGHSPVQLGWFDAQAVQAPALELPIEWLESTHLDEVLMPLPSSHGRLRLALADPALALAQLEQPSAELEAFNQLAKERLDALAQRLQKAVPTPIDFVRVPVLFTRVGDLARSSQPNAVNVISLGNRVLVGRPEHARFRSAIQTAYEHAGFEVQFVDTTGFASLNGAVHCAVQVERAHFESTTSVNAIAVNDK